MKRKRKRRNVFADVETATLATFIQWACLNSPALLVYLAAVEEWLGPKSHEKAGEVREICEQFMMPQLAERIAESLRRDDRRHKLIWDSRRVPFEGGFEAFNHLAYVLFRMFGFLNRTSSADYKYWERYYQAACGLAKEKHLTLKKYLSRQSASEEVVQAVFTPAQFRQVIRRQFGLRGDFRSFMRQYSGLSSKNVAEFCQAAKHKADYFVFRLWDQGW